MKQAFKLKNGELVFDSEKIIITDNAKKQRRFQLLASVVWIFYGTISVVRYFKTGDQFLLWSGVFIGLAHFIILLVILFRRTNKNEIMKDEIISIKINQRFGNKFVDFKLAGNKIRRICQADGMEDELKEYVETYMNTK